MLNRVSIRNIALISEVDIDLSKGFTTITGETGAGKSILMDSLGLALGARSDTSLIRHGAGSASIEAVFDITHRQDIKKLLDEYALEGDDANEVVFRRYISPEKSRAFVNGMQVNLTQMKVLGDRLVDIHGQHDHQQILNPARHSHMLDHFGGLKKMRESVKESYQAWRKVYLELEDLKSTACARMEEQDLWRIYAEEIERFSPEKGEEETLSEERKQLMAGEKNVQNLSAALELLSGDVDITGRMGQAESAIASLVGEGSEDIDSLYERFANVSHEISDIIAEIESLGHRLEPNPERLAEVDERLFALKDLARKHQTTVDGLPDVLESLHQKLSVTENVDEHIAVLEKRIAEERQVFDNACKKLSDARKETAEKLSVDIKKSLTHLEMPNAEFMPKLNALDAEKWNENGSEQVAFMVATNKGSPLKPLEKVASGGEISRLMLALKEVFYGNMPSTTLVFDEVDTGVSGSVAEAMAEAMFALSKNHQVFSITHLPQVAAKGHQQIFISKHTENDETFTTLTHLEKGARVEEVARMIAGKSMTEEAKAAAQKLLG